MRIENGRLRNEQLYFRLSSHPRRDSVGFEGTSFVIPLQGMLGVALHLALLFLVFFSPIYGAALDPYCSPSCFRLGVSLTTLVSFLAAFFLTQVLETRRGQKCCRACSMAATAGFLASLIPTFFGTSLADSSFASIWIGTSSALTGAGLGALMLVTSLNFAHLKWEQSVFMSISATGTAALIYLAFSAFNLPALMIAGSLLPVGAIGFSQTPVPTCGDGDAPLPEQRDAKGTSPDSRHPTTRKRERYYFKRTAVAFSYSLCAGFFSGMMTLYHQNGLAMTLIVGIGSLLISLALLLVFIRTSRNLGFVYNRVFFPAAALALMLLLVLPSDWQAVDLALLFLITLPGDIFDTASKGLATSDPHPMRDVAGARIFSVAATVAGIGGASAIIASPHDSELRVLVVVALVLVLILATSISMLVPNEDEEFSAFLKRDEESAPQTQSNEPDPSPLFDYDLEASIGDLAKRYRLTDREKEITIFLARGRNTSYIQQSLVLSKSTVKSHMQHIYKKLDVHSQQQLIDLIEEFSRHR